MQYPFLGRGWSFPPTFDRNISGVEMLEEADDIASSLEILLSTLQGERVMLPQYGCNLDELLFEGLDTRMKTLLADKIESAVLYHEPRIELENVILSENDDVGGVVTISIDYRVKTTNSRFNLVFPYYLQEGTDVNLSAKLNLLPDNS